VLGFSFPLSLQIKINEVKNKMDFYKRKMNAIKAIEGMIDNKVSKDQIIYNIQKTFGFSELMVNKHLNLLFNIKEEKEKARLNQEVLTAEQERLNVLRAAVVKIKEKEAEELKQKENNKAEAEKEFTEFKEQVNGSKPITNEEPTTEE